MGLTDHEESLVHMDFPGYTDSPGYTIFLVYMDSTGYMDPLSASFDSVVFPSPLPYRNSV